MVPTRTLPKSLRQEWLPKEDVDFFDLLDRPAPVPINQTWDSAAALVKTRQARECVKQGS